ncbi:DUF3888 domain-containing protein [Alkalihalobacillus pseudalcaliphilus]|uniref:DUF3888 domain-containing protein n=1 Tax=Alkalihalobacillus pseudalcaliphilus TaxID=79884 RepID=UPI00064D903D|nr:DUF3888 domain-containing protein [Alkalihalobacillus pseudalcaliphilus]KMK77148.1 hypothetical protein AB990_06250 [Alkalihalobacillus pseudalcaliphilus]
MRRWKFMLTLTVLSTLIILLANINVADAVTEQSIETKLILTLLYPATNKAINDVYPDREFDLWNAEIKSIKQNDNEDYDYTAIVEYNTYTGPHNPPEGNVLIEYLISLKGVKVENIKGAGT